MHTSGPGPASPILPFLPNTSPVQRPAATAPPAALTGPSAASPSAGLGPSSTAAAPVSSAPTGVDPKLWAVLTADEQQFFHQMAALGPLTYGARQSQIPPDAPVGQRVDVRG